MKIALLCAAALIAAPSISLAQAQTTPAPAAKPLVINEDTTIESIAATPTGKAALEKNIPELLPHPAYEQFKGMSLRQLAPLSGGIVTPEKIAAVEASLKAAN
jgi:hypothetical protein